MALRFSPARGTAALVLNAMVRGPTGAAATIVVGTVSSLTPGATPTVTNVGDAADAVFNFGIPTSKTVAVGTTTTGAEGTSAAVSDSGTSSASIFDFTIPRGSSPAIGYTFSTTTTDSDPGAGIVRFNNATPASITTIYFDNLDADANTVTAWLDTMDDSTTSGNKGALTFTDVTAPSTKMAFTVTGSSVVDGTGYRKVTVSHLSGATLFTDARRLAVQFARSGDKGADGIGDVNGPSSSVDGEIALYDSTSGKLLKRASTTGLLKAASGVLSAATAGTDYYNPGGTDVAVVDGGTGASTAPGALANLAARGQGTETISVPGTAIWARTTAGPGTASRELTTGDDIMIKGLAFDATTEEAAQFYLRMPKSWNLGTVTAQVYWTNASGLTTETVTWGISAVALHDSDPIDSTSLGTEVTVTDTWLAQNDMHISSVTSAITFANTPAVGDLCIVQIARKTGTDNMTGDVELLDLVLFFTTNAVTDA